jgi:hypothetical protein
MENNLGRFRCSDSGMTLLTSDDEEKTCTCLKVPCECEKSEDEEFTPIQKFKAASDKRWGLNQSTSTRTPTADELSKMTPEQRFTASSNRLRGIK